jgi:SHS2 domain-containing protein
MSLDAFLNQTCTITREVASGTDRYNNATTSTTTVASNLRCRKVQKSMRMMDERTGEYAFVRADLVLLPSGTTVKAKDKITINTVEWRVQTVLTRQRFNEQHHLSCLVEAINVA